MAEPYECFLDKNRGKICQNTLYLELSTRPNLPIMFRLMRHPHPTSCVTSVIQHFLLRFWKFPMPTSSRTNRSQPSLFFQTINMIVCNRIDRCVKSPLPLLHWLTACYGSQITPRCHLVFGT